MFKKTLIALAAVCSLSAHAGTYQFNKMKIEAEMTDEKITMQRCMGPKNCLSASANKEKLLLELEAAEVALGEAAKDMSKVYKDALAQAKEKIAAKKDIIEDGEEKYVMLELVEGTILLPVNIEKLDGVSVTIDHVIANKIKAVESAFAIVKGKLPADIKTKDYSEFRDLNDLFFYILKVQEK